MKKGFLYIIIILLLAIIFCCSKCNGGEHVVTITDTVTTTVYIHDTIKIQGKTKIKPVPITRWIHDTIIDSTGKIIIVDTKKYFTLDTFDFKTDSTKITIYTKVYSDCPLDSISTEFKAIIRHRVIENIITKEVVKKHAFYAGSSISANKNMGYISLDGLYKHKDKTIYRVGVGVNNQFQPMLNAGVYWQISK